MVSSFKDRKGFTLVELIIVIAIIAILAAGIFVAVDPARRLHETRNARRRSDVTNILDALVKYQADNGGTHYSTVAALTNDLYYVVGSSTSGCNSTCGAQTTEAACVNLNALPASYLAIMPIDPSSGSLANTDYYLRKGSAGNLTIGSCDPEGEGVGGAGTPPAVSVAR